MNLKLSEDLAEALGMFAADGNLQSDHVSLWGNIYEDKEYYDLIVCPLFSRLFNKRVVAHEKKSNSVYGFYICDKEVINVFKSFGFTKRKTYNVGVPERIFNSDVGIIAAFIRGFTDSDGCLNFVKRYEKGYNEFKRKYHTYPRIYIRIVSQEMILGLSLLLVKLKIGYSVYTCKSRSFNEKDAFVIAVRGKARLSQWMNFVGFNNASKKMKYDIWKTYGFCPSLLSFQQKKDILSGKTNLFAFY